MDTPVNPPVFTPKPATVPRMEHTCPECGKVSFSAYSRYSFTWDCPHCESLNIFRDGQNRVFADAMAEDMGEMKRREWGSISV